MLLSMNYRVFFTNGAAPRRGMSATSRKARSCAGLFDAKSGDTLIFSDVDEIPKASAVRTHAGHSSVSVFEQRLYAYYLNNICTDYDTHGQTCVAQYNRDGLGWWRGSVMLDFDSFKSIGKSIKKMRLLHDRTDVNVIPDSGWHFTSIGDVERIALKLESYEHSEANTDETKNPAAMKKRIPGREKYIRR